MRPPVDGERLRELPALKEALAINIELASPPDFIPELPGWRERSPLVFDEGNVEVRHFDFYSQALSKIERGFRQDLEDVEQMLTSGRSTPAQRSSPAPPDATSAFRESGASSQPSAWERTNPASARRASPRLTVGRWAPTMSASMW